MLKNIILLGVLTWVSLSHAKTPVAQESIADAEAYKVEQAHKDMEAKREIAGGKAKKDKQKNVEETSSPGPDSEVRYWEYSDEE